MRLLRDVFLEDLYNRMKTDDSIFILSDDMGAPVLDKVREEFSDRFINVGIAEQNLIGVATGLALEGYQVICYAIAPFYLRAYEQIRVNLALTATTNPLSVCFIGVGAGISYDVSGPTHHCIDDIAAFRSLPGIDIYSPSDPITTTKCVESIFKSKKPSYVRLDGKKLPNINSEIEQNIGFISDHKKSKTVVLSTGYMTHFTNELKENLLKNENITISIIDLYQIEGLDDKILKEELLKYEHVITIEEGFLYRGGVDTKINSLLKGTNVVIDNFGLTKPYTFSIASREKLHDELGLKVEDIKSCILNYNSGENL